MTTIKKIPVSIPPNRFQALVDTLLSTVRLDDLIRAAHIRVMTSDNESVAICPFHSPQGDSSLVINSDNDTFHCTRCGFRGTAIGWTMYYNGIDFLEAVMELAHGAGIACDEIVTGDAINVVKKRRNRLMKEMVEQYRLAAIASNQATDYLQGYRRIDAQQMTRSAWDVRSRASLEIQTKQGSVRYGVLGRTVSGDYYARFGGRVVFPIRDVEGYIIGFGGRKLDDAANGPKYLNSASSRYFQKQNILYGLYESLSCSRSPDRFYVVEGYMDVIALHQAGFRSAVATLGTTINCAQILQLFRFTDQISLCFDSDKAGSDATLKAICQALSVIQEGQVINVISMPEGLDPDSFLIQYGAAEFSARVVSAESVEVWLRDRFIRDALGKRQTSRIDQSRIEPDLTMRPDVSTRARVAMAFAALIPSIANEKMCADIKKVAEVYIGTRL